MPGLVGCAETCFYVSELEPQEDSEQRWASELIQVLVGFSGCSAGSRPSEQRYIKESIMFVHVRDKWQLRQE